MHIENDFLARGLATLSLDGPGQGETGLSSKIEPAYERPLGAVLDQLAGRDDVDLDRVGLMGVSLGGYYAPRAAAYERRVRAAVGISGPYKLDACWDVMPLPSREAIVHNTRAATLEEGRTRAAELTLVDAAPLLDRPYLAITGRHDRLIPWEQTKAQADAAPGGELVIFEDGNHVCNNIPFKYRPLAADWLSEKLAG
jgi:2,6-dihydroxypseudooxynicotine hydrolase